jgi:putative Ca2+/H+ antiporter (TMEM165/GDT1 family)
MVTVAAAAATILWGTPDFGAVGSILIGSIPGILIGSMFTKRVNHRLLRGGIAIVLAMSGLRLLDPPSWTYAAAGAVIVAFGAWYFLREQAHNTAQQQAQPIGTEPHGSPISR